MPELKVYERRGPWFMRALLKRSASAVSGERKMVKVQQPMPDRSTSSWIGEMDLNGFPTKPHLEMAVPVTSARGGVAQNPIVRLFNQMCVACHTMGGQRRNGCYLDGLAAATAEYLSAWLQEPGSVKPGTKMPSCHSAAKDIAELTAFLSTQGSRNAESQGRHTMVPITKVAFSTSLRHMLLLSLRRSAASSWRLRTELRRAAQRHSV